MVQQKQNFNYSVNLSLDLNYFTSSVYITGRDAGEELSISSRAHLFERRQIRRTVATTNTTPQEGVYSLSVGHIGEAPPSTARKE